MRRFGNAFLLLSLIFAFQASGFEISDSNSWKAVPEQSVDRGYNRDFDYQHDKGFFLSVGLGPQWNQSIQKPAAGAVRFGGKLALGFVPAHNLAVHLNVWGNFLEQASLIAIGPGVTYFIGDSNVGLGAQFGVGQVFSTSLSKDQAFKETVLAVEGSAGKYWWLSGHTSLGLALVSGLHGFTLSQASFNSVGWHAGLRLEFIYN